MSELLKEAGSTSNIQRNILRRWLRGSKWPKPFFAEVPFRHPKSLRRAAVQLPFLLPHEVAHALFGELGASLADLSNLDSHGQQEMRRMERQLKIEGAIPMGMWADATPISWDRKESLDIISLSFPGVGGKLANLRVPLVCWPHRWLHTDTKHAALKVLAWSCRWATAGVAPAVDHEGWGGRCLTNASQAIPLSRKSTAILLRASVLWLHACVGSTCSALLSMWGWGGGTGSRWL